MGRQTTGVGLPRATGAALSRPGEPVVFISGNGSFLMSCMDLQNIGRLKLSNFHRDWRVDTYNLVALLARRNSGRVVGIRVGPTDFLALAGSTGAVDFSA